MIRWLKGLLFPKQFEETHFKVDLGKGEEIKTWYEMQCLSQEERDYLFRNAKQCTTFNGEIDDWDVSNVTKITDIMSKPEIDAILNKDR